MKKNKKNNKLWMLMTASILAVMAVFGLLVLYNNNHIQYSYYHKKLTQFKQENETIEFCDVVFLGDSLTDSYSLKAHYPRYAMLNRGIGGDTTQGVIERLEESVFKVEPKVVVLLIGGNDVARDRSNDYILSNYKIIINDIKNKIPNTKIIMQSMYPLGAEFMAKHEIMKYLNKELIKIAQETGCRFVDVFSSLVDEVGYLNPKYTVEGIHLNNDGYAVVTSVLKPIIDEMLN